MKRKRFGLLSFLCLVIILLVSKSYLQGVEAKGVIKSGFIDLSRISSPEGKVYSLGGDVHFFPGKLFKDTVEANQFSSSLLSITNSWNTQKSRYESFPKFGCGTYHFSIILPDNWVEKALIIRPRHFISYASEFFIDGKLVANNGQVGYSKDDVNYRPSRKTVPTSFTSATKRVEVFVQVANFNHFRGGIFNEIDIGLAENMIENREKEIFKDLMIIISLLVMFLYHFILFFVNHRDKVPFYFSLTCLVFAVDFSFQDTMTFFLLFPDIGFQLANVLHLSMPYLIAPSFIYFLYSLYPNETSKRIRDISGIVALIMLSITIFKVPFLTFLTGKPHYAYIFFLVVYVYVPVAKAIKNRKNGAVFFLISYVVFSLCAINDILHVFEVIHTTSLVSVGLIIFVFLLSVLQGQRVSFMYMDNLRLSEGLKKSNIELESKVALRTRELASSLDRLKKLGAFKDDMVAMIVHDLKNPLNSIIGNANSNKVRIKAIQMLNMVNNILDIQKFEEASVKLKKEHFSFIEVLNAALEELKAPIKSKNLKVTIDLRTDIVLHGDKTLIKRVVSNLISNAIKYSPIDGHIDVKAYPVEEDIRVEIDDNGPGIANEYHQYVFEKFNQINAANLGMIRSTGLGLTFCKLSIEAHGGDIGVRSDGKSGSMFWFSINGTGGENKLELPIVSWDIDEENNFSNHEISMYRENLRGIKFYEVSKIRSKLRAIDSSSNTKLIEWKGNVLNAVSCGDEKRYYHLIKREENES